MGEEEAAKRPTAPEPSQPTFLEVTCESSGEVRRFAAGTEAGFALHTINRKLKVGGAPLAVHIEAVKQGEEPITFGPNAILVDYGEGWNLQAVTEGGVEEAKGIENPAVASVKQAKFGHAKKPNDGLTLPMVLVYMGKLLLAFAFMFLFAGALTLLLEKLPSLISLMTPYLQFAF